MAVEVERQQQEQAAQGHMDHIMKSGFTMNDIKGLHRYGEEAAEVDDGMSHLNPTRPSRKASVSRGSPTFDMMGSMARSASALDIDFSMDAQDDKADKKRGRSPFNFFKKSRDQSKDKHKSKSPPDRSRGRGTCKPQYHTFRSRLEFCVYIFLSFKPLDEAPHRQCTLEHLPFAYLMYVLLEFLFKNYYV